MKLTLESSEGDVKKLQCSESINIDMNVEATNLMEDLLGTDCYRNKVLLNMEKAASISSTGVAWLVKCHRQFHDHGGKLVLHSIPPMVHNVLKLLNMPKLLHIAEDEQEALALISE